MAKTKLATKSQIRQAVNILNEAIASKVKSSAEYQVHKKTKKSMDEKIWNTQDQLKNLLDQQRKLQEQQHDLQRLSSIAENKMYRLVYVQQTQRKPEVDKLVNDATMEIINLQQLNEAVASFKP